MGRATFNAGEGEPTSGFPLLPPGEYDLKITEAQMGTSKKSGFPQAMVNFVVVNGLEHEGKPLKFHYVTFIPDGQKGNGMAKTFLKALGQPYKGAEVVVDSDAWIGKVIHADVGVENYEGKQKNKLGFNIKAYEGPEIKSPVDEECPFA